MKEINIPVSSSDVGGQDVRKEEAEKEGGGPDVEEINDRGLQRSTSPELEPAAVPQSPEANVDCPICQGSFPATEIEMHAAYCDGEVAVVDERRPKADCFQVSSKPRRKRARRAEVTAEETSDSSNSGKNQEKCYICQKAVPLRDYSRHTELCIHRQASKTAAKGNLLSALEQTESRGPEAGPSRSKLQPEDIIDLRDDDDDDEEEEEEGDVSALQISNSPIRSFTPISEATGCLIDFKKQRAKKLSQRRR
ncbi:BRCA1-A complex subunit RAP80 [Enoplosus armatus]|uniref:BRCA1-A complex subunit RAP80 n=1 Tax=Enoplosus armatus TaxID=215367 RepID=UPI003992B638